MIFRGMILALTLLAGVAAAADDAPAPFMIGARFLDAEGGIHAVGDAATAGQALVFYLSGACALPDDYASRLNQLADRVRASGNYVYGVFTGGSDDTRWQAARAFRKRAGFRFPLFADPSGDLAARVTLDSLPAAFSYDVDGALLYGGPADQNLHPSLAGAPRCPAPPAPGAIANLCNPCNPCADPAPPAPGAITTPTYHRDIAPILAANCLECHRTGGIGPFSMEHYHLARAFAPLMKQVTASRRMPPWKPGPKPGVYRSERILSPRQIALIAAWTDAGAPEGDPAHAAPAAQLGDVKWRMGKPDLVLKVPEPFSVPASGDDIYRYFVLPSGLTTDQVVVGLDFRPGDPSVVHHANYFADYSGKARAEDAKDDAPGFSVFGTGAFMSYDNDDEQSFGIGGWTPGAEPYRTPGEVGMYLPAGADIVIEVHYKLSGRATTDQSEIALYFSDRVPPKFLDGLLIGTQDLAIPPGDDDYWRHFWMDVPVGFTLVDLMPHMHYIGKEARIIVTFPDGKTLDLLHIRNWELGWQNIYALRELLHLPAGSRLDVWFSYDNSAQNPANPHSPPQEIRWGWASDDEMAEVWMGIIPDDWNRRDELIQASQASWYRSADPWQGAEQ